MNRPLPPQLSASEFRPAPEVEAWMRRTFIEPGGPIANPDHEHLQLARIGVLWTAVEGKSKGNRVVGMAELPLFRGHPWVKARQRWQLEEWFGEEPDFVITLDAEYSAEADDASWCSLVEHELYHCAQKVDEYGAPRFNSQTGEPLWTLRGHDVEEFVAIVERYGVGAAAGRTRELVEAAKKRPSVAKAAISGACGTCNGRLAA